MAKEIDLSTFQASSDSTSASQVPAILPDTVQSECIHTPIECIPQEENAPYSIEQIASICGVARRTAFKYAAEVIEIHFWLEEADFRVNGQYCQFALDEIKRRKSYAKLEEYRQAVQDENADKPQLTGQLATTEIVKEEPTVGEIARIRQDRYHVPNTGSNRLAKAQQTHQTQRSNLQNTRERVQQAFFGLAVQTHENLQAEQLESEAGKEQTFEQAYADELERIQLENAAREAARADYAAFQNQVRMGNVPTPTAASASA